MLGILAASNQIPQAPLARLEVLGELSLGGEIRPVCGALPAALQCTEMGHDLLVPEANAAEAMLARTVTVRSAPNLVALGAALHAGAVPEAQPATGPGPRAETDPELADVRGKAQARRALEIAAAGSHSLLLIGPPGSGKSMLASRLPRIMPPLTAAEAIEVATVASVADGVVDPGCWVRRPFRHPHHTASGVALVGSGSVPRPGEITLAHHGVLFLDEHTEFDRRDPEVLREPLEFGRITISRAARQTEFPARFQLIAAMNPCPCGYLGDAGGRCRCTPDQISRYRARLSGPLLDRIDLQVFVSRVEHAGLTAVDAPSAESSAAVRQRVIAARHRQMQRCGACNAALQAKRLEGLKIDAATRTLLQAALSRLALSARAYHRVLRVARTIADLASDDTIAAAHVAEAVRYRELERGAAELEA